MKRIHKKVLGKEYMDALLGGKKSFECRLADWECNLGDLLILEEIDEQTKAPTGRALRKKVGYVANTKNFKWFAPEEVEKYGYQIISLLDYNDLWEVSVKTVIFNPEKTKILMPLYNDNTYGSIGGHLDYGETFDQALRREIKEETGIDFTGDATEIAIVKHEHMHERGFPIHKIVIYYSLTLPEDAKLTLEEWEYDGEGTVSLDWVPLDDVLSGENPAIFHDYVETVKKALKKEEKQC
jgi:8-oxo-dGTP pyrophosphatase MutT (NUDIX family)